MTSGHYYRYVVLIENFWPHLLRFLFAVDVAQVSDWLLTEWVRPLITKIVQTYMTAIYTWKLYEPYEMALALLSFPNFTKAASQ